VDFELVLDGSCNFSSGATYGYPDAACGAAGALGGPPNLNVGVSNDRVTSVETLTWAAGTALPIGGYLSTSGYAWNGLFDASFSDTLHVYAWSTTPGVVITSASGHDYSPPSAVPEPRGALLLAAGLATFALLQARRRLRPSAPAPRAGTCRPRA
jgi:hypothetical protein